MRISDCISDVCSSVFSFTAMEKRGLELVASAKYKRNTIAVKESLLRIRKADPQAVVMVGAYKPIAEFIKVARRIRMNPTFVNISFVGSDALAKELGRDGEGVVITQVVPLPWDSSIPLVQQYQDRKSTRLNSITNAHLV